MWKNLNKEIWHGKTTSRAINLKVNIEKIKIIKTETNEGPVFTSGKYQCGVCKKGVGVNSVYYSF